MKITDLAGQVLEVTDLQEAIRQAEIYKDTQYNDNNYKNLDEALRRYWTDIYEKLLKLKNKEHLAGTG